ncbi:hypothetical protein ACFL20_07810 [Spirochaetota bacterium]
MKIYIPLFKQVIFSLIFANLLILSCVGEISTASSGCSRTQGAGCHTSVPELGSAIPSTGLHADHLTNDDVECVDCHYEYGNNTQHENGTVETANLVYFNPPGTVWDDSGRTCSNIGCHEYHEGSGPHDWDDQGGCSNCH